MFKLTLRHKIRLLFGIHGESINGYYFNILPEKFINLMPVTFRKFWWNTVMFKYLSPFLNKIIGYKSGDWIK
jgi:hypothetical protein